MRVLVTGGRDFEDARLMFRVLERLDADRRVDVVIHGGASGADRLAAEWADLAMREVLRFPADWRTHGRAAGPIRNQQMLDEGQPDLVVAFPGGRGTADCVRRAREAGVRVIEVAGERVPR